MVMRIGADDFLRSTLLPTDWYPAVISSYVEDSDKNNAALHVFEAKIESGEFKDVPLRIQFSEKAMGFAKEFAEALRGKAFTKEEMAKGFSFGETQDEVKQKVMGKKLKVHVSPGMYNGRQNNQTDGFRSYEAKA